VAGFVIPIGLLLLAALYILSALLSVASVGKPRQPLTGDTAVVIVVMASVAVTILVIAAVTYR
jgi:hypothetical protein